MKTRRGSRLLLLLFFSITLSLIILYPKQTFAKFQLEGVFPTILAPLTSQGVIDKKALREEIDFVMQNGASGIVLLGSIGEGHYLPQTAREDLIRTSKEALGSRGKMIVNTLALDTYSAIAQGEQAKKLGADFLSVQVPTFFELGGENVKKHLQRIIEAVGLPMIYYDYPDATNVNLTENQLEEILLLDGVVGAKITSLQYNRVRDLMRRVHQVRPDVAFFTGTVFNLKWFLDEGGAGVIDPVSLFEPSAASRLVARYREAEHATRRRARECMQEVNNLQEYLDSYLPFFQDKWSDPVALSSFLNTIGRIFGVDIGRISYHARSKYLLNRRGFSMPIIVSDPLPQLSTNDVKVATSLENYLDGLKFTRGHSEGAARHSEGAARHSEGENRPKNLSDTLAKTGTQAVILSERSDRRISMVLK